HWPAFSFSLARVNRRLFLDQEILDLLALGDLCRQPARLLAAAGPGFGLVGRVAVLGRDLAKLAALPGRLFRHLAGGGLRAGGAAEQFLDGVALGFGLGGDLGANRRDRLALLQGCLAALGLG